jgi:hypothetical protein
MVQYGQAIFDALAPDIQSITVCNAPELAKKPSVLTQAIRVATYYVTYKPGRFLRLALPLIRRAEHAAYEYGQGRTTLARFLELRAKQDDRLEAYACALSHFEQCIMQAYMALTLYEKLTGQDLFVTGEHSDAERLNRHYNNIKHFAGDVVPPNGKLRTERTISTDHTITSPVWITDAGIKSHEGILEWATLKEILDDLLRCAEVLATAPTPNAAN